jgi:hypothetical protein
MALGPARREAAMIIVAAVTIASILAQEDRRIGASATNVTPSRLTGTMILESALAEACMSIAEAGTLDCSMMEKGDRNAGNGVAIVNRLCSMVGTRFGRGGQPIHIELLILISL